MQKISQVETKKNGNRDCGFLSFYFIQFCKKLVYTYLLACDFCDMNLKQEKGQIPWLMRTFFFSFDGLCRSGLHINQIIA